jgi:hypothetical protein
MSSVFASLDEAFNGPANPGKTKKKRSAVPGALGGSPDPDRPAEIPPVDPMGLPKQDFFPLPGEPANAEPWSNAFMLEGSQIPAPVNGKSTLWRKIEKPVTPVSSVPPVTTTAAPDSDVYKRLDMLTKQLEALTQVHPMQSTAELFLFVAIGLIFLLAIDTLLHFATTLAVGRRMRGGGRLLNRRWFK